MKTTQQPNILLVMTDDQGWGDVAYNGNPTVKTPHLDTMAREAVRLDRFYAAAPVCSPTRGSCLTGRHPFRYNIPWAGDGHLPMDEISLAKALKTAGYATGHFGKWHVGQLSKTVVQNEFDLPADPAEYAPPWEHGFDECFSTESMVPTYNPYYYDGGIIDTEGFKHVMDKPVKHGDTSGTRWTGKYPALYWTGPGQVIDDPPGGCDSNLIMDQALEFLDRKLSDGNPVFECIWFHAPHTPIVAGDDMRALYPHLSCREQHWYGCLSALDAQIGRLRRHLREKEVAENTLIWFCSDNGPSYIHDLNSAGPFRGKKGSLYEGGIRVPAIVEWPAGLTGGRVVDAPLVTSDFYPTLLNIAGVHMPEQPELDGIDVLPILAGEQTQRNAPIGFQSPIKDPRQPRSTLDVRQMAWSDEPYKLITLDGGRKWALYDLNDDPAETIDLAAAHPEIYESMKAQLLAWSAACDADAARLTLK